MSSAQAAFGAVVALVLAVGVSCFFVDLHTLDSEQVVFLVFLGAFSLKVFLDDFSHFGEHAATLDIRKKLARGFGMSLLMWLSFVFAAVFSRHDLALGVFCMILAILSGTIWLGINQMHMSHQDPDNDRHGGFVVLNCIYVAGLTTYLAFAGKLSPTISYVVFPLLTGVVLFDTYRHKTFFRLTAKV